jgi:hypothetical protein
MENKTNKTIVKINASLEQADKWKQNAKELNKSRSEYLIDIIEKNNKPSLLELIVNKIKGN